MFYPDSLMGVLGKLTEIFVELIKEALAKDRYTTEGTVSYVMEYHATYFTISICIMNINVTTPVVHVVLGSKTI